MDPNNNPQPTNPTPEETPSVTPEAPDAVTTPTPEAASATPNVPISTPQPFQGADTQATSPSPFNNGPVTTPTVSSLPPSPKKSHVKLIALLAGIVGGVIVLVIAGLIVYFTFFTVSRQDYANAVTTANGATQKLSDSYSDISTLASDVDGDGSSISSDATKVQNDLKSVEAINTTLSNMKAVRNDKDVKAKFDAYITKFNAYNTYGNNLAASYKLIQPYVVDANSLSNDSSSDATPSTIIASMQKIKSDADAATKAPDQDIAAFAKVASSTIADGITNLQAALTAEASGNDDAYNTAYNAYSNDETTLDDAGTTYDSNANKHLSAVDPTDAYNAFIGELNAKISK